MDVSRIEAISPRQIDWRKLTANQIIKYENQGIEIPSQYLQWAKEFIQDVESAQKDDLTYEMATSQPAAEAIQTPQSQDSSISSQESGLVVQSANQEQKTAAQQKKENMQDSGASLRTMAKEFTKNSSEAEKDTAQSASTINITQQNSNNEIQSLESFMQELLSKAETTRADMKNEISAINSNRSDKSTFAKIDKLQKQLEGFGIEGQTEISNSESDFNIYNSTINSQSGTILNAQDFGSVTSAVGQELLDSIGHSFFAVYDYIIGKRAISQGDRAVEISELTLDMQNGAISINNGNLSKVQGYKAQVQSQTGISANDIPKNSENNPDDNSQNQSSSLKTVGITETDKAATANLEQILQSKIRKGEDVNT